MERIDTDQDGFVSFTELRNWIKHRQSRYIEDNVNKHWKDYDMNNDDKIAWQEYKNTTYGFYLGNWESKMNLHSVLCSPFSFFNMYLLLSLYCRLLLLPFFLPLWPGR